MVHLLVNSPHRSQGDYEVEWTIDTPSRYLIPQSLRVSYSERTGLCDLENELNQQNLEKSLTYALLSLLLPVACIEFGEVCVRLPFAVDDTDVRYWDRLLKKLGLETARLIWESSRSQEAHLTFGRPPDGRPDRMGLFFGGGIESVTALSKIIDRNPVLLSIIGPYWMNNNTAADRGIKERLESDLCDRFSLDMWYIRQNGRLLLAVSEPSVHYYSLLSKLTGPSTDRR